VSERPWYKRYAGNFVMGTMNLTLEERGAYSLCLDLIYDRGGAIPDDERWLAGICRISTRRWRVIRAKLIQLGKLVEVDGRLHNRRAQAEIDLAQEKADADAENGAAGGRKRAENSSKTDRKLIENGSKTSRNFVENEPQSAKNNDLGQARLKPNQKEELDIRYQSSSDPLPRARPKNTNGKVVRMKSRRCPPDWVFGPGVEDVGLSEGLSTGQIERQLAMMRDHEFRDAHSDWDAVARNWLRRAAADERKRHDRQPTFRDLDFEAHQANLDRMFRASGVRTGPGR
jgi:uncharacterized protein YdaU (DUF1376 family)